MLAKKNHWWTKIAFNHKYAIKNQKDILPITAWVNTVLHYEKVHTHITSTAKLKGSLQNIVPLQKSVVHED